MPKGIAPPMLIMPLIPLTLYNKFWVINGDTSRTHTAPNWLISIYWMSMMFLVLDQTTELQLLKAWFHEAFNIVELSLFATL